MTPRTISHDGNMRGRAAEFVQRARSVRLSLAAVPLWARSAAHVAYHRELVRSARRYSGNVGTVLP